MGSNLEAALFAGFLVLFMQAGFGLVATGLSRGKNAAHTMALHLMVLCFTLAGFFSEGFAQMGDGPAWKMHESWSFHHSRGYFLEADRNNPAALAWFLLTLGYAAVASAIPAGALVERWKLRNFAVFVFVVGALTFPIFACWMWTGGWLAQLGVKLGLGHGAVDYAGSSVVHVLGGTMALVAALFVRPRMGKYDEKGSPRPILGHHIPMVMAGAMILAFGWMGFTSGRSFLLNDGRAALIVVNTLISGAAGAIAAALYMSVIYGRPDPSLTCNGMVAGMVAICAPCAYVAPWAAFLIGLIGGVIAVWGVLMTERRGVDDPVGAVSVHGIAGVWGMIALGLFADGSFGDGTNGVAGNVRGVFYGGGGKQMVSQLIAVVACVVWAAIISWITLAVTEKVLGSNRVSHDVESFGLDIPEMGASGYPEFIAHMGGEHGPE
jgi:Amt family ammonium transporter